MENNTYITITARQRDDAGEEAVTRSSAAGNYCEKNGSVYVLYEENPEDGGPVTRNMIKWKSPVLELTRRGCVCTRMIFETGKEYLADYATSCGCLKMGILTHSLEASRRDGFLEIRAEYSLTSDGIPFSHCRLLIRTHIPSQPGVA